MEGVWADVVWSGIALLIVVVMAQVAVLAVRAVRERKNGR